jgi:hypothetical protein
MLYFLPMVCWHGVIETLGPVCQVDHQGYLAPCAIFPNELKYGLRTVNRVVEVPNRLPHQQVAIFCAHLGACIPHVQKQHRAPSLEVDEEDIGHD